jgi:hypothetical protein
MLFMMHSVITVCTFEIAVLVDHLPHEPEIVFERFLLLPLASSQTQA